MSDPDRLAEITEHLTDHQDIHEDDGWWLLGEVERRRDLLHRLEWSCRWASAKAVGICPECGAYEPGPHDPDCWLAVALARNDETPPRP